MTLPRALGSVGAIGLAAQTPVARAFDDGKNIFSALRKVPYQSLSIEFEKIIGHTLTTRRNAPTQRVNHAQYAAETLLADERTRAAQRPISGSASSCEKECANTFASCRTARVFQRCALGARGSKHRGQSPRLRGVEPWAGVDSVRDRHDRHGLHAETKTAPVLEALAPLLETPSLRP
jgi:hypothetical protein